LNPRQEEFGLYLHIPFCDRRCHFCPFFTRGYREQQASLFVADLQAEIRLSGEQRRLRGRTVGTIYFGGGTPTTLSSAQLISVLQACRETFALTPTAEISLEANPASVDVEMLETLHEEGFNRLSFGVQSFDEGELTMLGSPHRANDIVTAVQMARRTGWTNLSLDLIYALPGQTLDRFRINLEAAMAIAPEHISIYGFTLEEGTKLWRDAQDGRLAPLDDEASAEIYEAAITWLEEAGYRQYEISNFARPGFACRHNLGYWSDREWLGFGPSAHSYFEGTRFSNVESLDRYHRFLAQGLLPVLEYEAADPDLRFREAIAFGLRTVRGVELAGLEECYGIAAGERFKEPIAELVSGGWLSINDGFLRASSRGLLVADNLGRAFL
jgi:oxygen-independent coproporphyrinogen III oxidase